MQWDKLFHHLSFKFEAGSLVSFLSSHIIPLTLSPSLHHQASICALFTSLFLAPFWAISSSQSSSASSHFYIWKLFIPYPSWSTPAFSFPSTPADLLHISMNLQHSIIFCHAFPAYFRHNEPNKGSRVRALSTVACIKSPADLPHHFTSLIRGPKRLRREAAPTALWGKVGSLTNLPPINPFRVFPPQGCCKKKKHCVIALMNGGHCSPLGDLVSFV